MLSELPKEFALVALFIALALTAVLFLYSLGLRAANILHARDQRRLQARWWPVFAAASLAGERTYERPPAWPGPPSRDKLLREWCRFRSHVRGDCSRSLEALAKELGLLPVARRLLQKRSVRQQLLGVQALGFLRDTESWHAIRGLVEDKNVSLSITAATALVHIDAEKAVGVIVPVIAERRFWPRTQIGRMLSLAGPDVVSDRLCDQIASADHETASYLLQFYEAAYVDRVDSLAAELLIKRSDPGLLAAALKAVRGHLSDEIIARLAKHKVWYVRMQAANLLGRFGRREDYFLLEPLLADAEWWVRYRAAQAITQLPFLGPNALRKLRDRQSDRYAREIMVQALAEAGLQ